MTERRTQLTPMVSKRQKDERNYIDIRMFERTQDGKLHSTAIGIQIWWSQLDALVFALEQLRKDPESYQIVVNSVNPQKIVDNSVS